MQSHPLAPWLALHLVPGLGPARQQRLLQHFSSPEHILRAPRHQLREFGVSAAVIGHWDQWLSQGSAGYLAERIEASLAWAEQSHCAILTLDSPDYPSLLRWIPDPPALLFAQGRLEILGCPQLAVVGSRNPTPGGADNARAFAASLAQSGLTVTSGLAQGIDACAHQATLDAGGQTVAVVGTGIDLVYPAVNSRLTARLRQEGLVLSELALGTQPKAANFPRRNRIISGLSMGTLVVEASVRSGSLITARLAMEQGREVYGIPGSIHNPQARGCHQILKQGAKLVESVDDILEELPGMLAHYRALPLAPVSPAAPESGDLFSMAANNRQRPDAIPSQPEAIADIPSNHSDAARRLLDALGYDPVPLDLLVSRSGLPVQVVSVELMALELSGDICASANGYQRI